MSSLLTDPTNHPANGPLTAERITRLIAELQRSLEYQNGGDMAYVIADAIKGLEELLVSREAVPVAWMHDGEDGREYNGCNEFPYGGKGVPLYTAPPAPAVPEALPCPVLLEPGLRFGKGVKTQLLFDALKRRAEYYAELDAMTPGQRAEHDAGIAEFKAMLGGNSPVTPDGWQLVPKEPTVAMNKAGWAAINEHDEINPTYRAMLAAAPQQDVRLALEIGMSRYAGAMQKLVDSGD